LTGAKMRRLLSESEQSKQWISSLDSPGIEM
jgi:hypothetical protein